MDFVIPTKNNPKILIECSYVTTTASGMGDKASNEFRVAMNIKRHFNDHVRFWGFVDGVGWYVRRSDLKNLVSAFENVYTFNLGELDKFLSDVKGVLDM